MFVTLNSIRLSLLLTGKVRSLPLECSSARIGLSLAHKYWIRVEMTDICKHSSLLQFRLNYGCKKFIVEAKVFGPVSSVHPSLIFVGTVRSLHLERISVYGSTRVGYSLVCYTSVDVTDSNKHTILLQLKDNYDHKKL